MWVYLPHQDGEAARRVLLLEQKNKPQKEESKTGEESKEAVDTAKAEETKLEGEKKTLKGLGATAASQLRAMKVSEAEIIASSKINADILGEFTASLHTANFEFSQKSYIGAEEDFKGAEDDPRRTKHHVAIDDYTVSHESADF